MTLTALDAKNDRLRERLQGPAAAAILHDLEERLDASWIFHDSAVEGVVLGTADVQAAMAEGEAPTEGLSPAVPEIRLLRAAIRAARDLAAKRKRPMTLEVIRRFYTLVTPEAGGKATLYRRDNPLHRLYFHEIAPPERIAQAMKRLATWLDGADAARLHPVLRASRAHYELMRIFPWTRNSGRVARLLMNYLLLCDRHLPAVIHATDRQRYYESLRVLSSQPGEDEDEASQLTEIVVEAMDNGLDSALRFVEEAARDGRRLRAAS
jgi:Fic family protein